MSKRILIIDDEENIRHMIGLTLEATGYEVAEAKGGYEAFAILGDGTQWNVILLDQRLPIMEGTEVLRRIKVLAPSAAVVMMTAFASIDLAVEAMKLGATDFLRKPMTPEILRNSVAAAIRKVPVVLSEEHTNANRDVSALSRTVTLNGFTISRASVLNGGLVQQTNERRFLIRKADGKKQEVVVEISAEALKSAEQITQATTIISEFWTSQAENFLSTFIWNDGNAPTTGRLILKGVDRSELEKLAHQK